MLRLAMATRNRDFPFSSLIASYNPATYSGVILPFVQQKAATDAASGKGSTTYLIRTEHISELIPLLETHMPECEVIVHPPKVELWTPIKIDWS